MTVKKLLELSYCEMMVDSVIFKVEEEIIMRYDRFEDFITIDDDLLMADVISWEAKCDIVEDSGDHYPSLTLIFRI